MKPEEIERMVELEVARAMTGKYKAQVATRDDLKKIRTYSMELDTLQEGDVFIIPTDFEKKNMVLTRMVNAKAKVAYMILPVKDADGKDKVVTVFPSSFVKKRTSLEWDREEQEYRRIGVIKSSGTACAAYAEKTNMFDSLANIAGRQIRVTRKDLIITYEYGQRTTTETSILTLDFVDQHLR